MHNRRCLHPIRLVTSGRAALWGLFLAAFLLPASVALAAFPQTPPNDPGYNPLETGNPDCATTSVSSEQHYFYSFIPQCTPNATDPEGASGMSIDKAWAQYSDGRPDVVIAYIEGGINWHDESQARELVDKVFINRGELPLPKEANGKTRTGSREPYDLNGDGVFNAADYRGDPRVQDANNNGMIDPEDLIVAFSNGKDSDQNGFTDDISGWDFYNRQNDPAMYDSTYGHSDNQMRQAAAQTNNKISGAGVCPRCLILPIKAGAEALDRTDDLAQAWLYADLMGAKVVSSVTADLGYSSYMRQAVEKLWRDGVVMAESSNDFSSIDHQGGMFWPHVLPGNGLVANSHGVPAGQGANALTTTYRERSDETSWGTHAMFSVATNGGSTSTSTPTTAGVFALLLSYGEKAAEAGKISRPLTNDEAIQVMRATASDIVNPNPPIGWRGTPGWDLQYGYGRPNVFKAMRAVAQGNIPPVGWFESPRWYRLFDPTRTNTVKIKGHVAAPRSSAYHWTLEYAPGANPPDGAFRVAGQGGGSQPFDGTLGAINLSAITKSYWKRAFKLSETKYLRTNDRYTVTLRLRVTDAQGRVGKARRAIAVHHGTSSKPGFPKFIGPSVESEPALADLQGSGHMDLVFGDSDGRVHAIDGVTGQSLPGWPVTTNPTQPERQYKGISPGHEPIIDPVSIGDLDHDGKQEVVVPSSTGRVYVFEPDGSRRPGWPKVLDKGVVTPQIPRRARKFTRLPALGATAPTVLYDLDGDGELDIIQAGWDGYLHAWHGDGSPVKGWPVKVDLPPGYSVKSGYSLVDDAKLDTPPAIADLDGDGKPEIVQKSQMSEVTGGGIQPLGRTHLLAYHGDGTPVRGWRPATLTGILEFYGSAQEFITEGSNAPTAADVDGDGADEIAASPIFSATFLLSGDGTTRRQYGPTFGDVSPLLGLLTGSGNVQSVLAGNLPANPKVAFTTSGAFGHFGGHASLNYAQPGTGLGKFAGSLLFTGSGIPVTNYERVFDATSGAKAPHFPKRRQGLDFLSAPVFADVTGDGDAELLDGGDSSALHGYTPDGTQAQRFPKYINGWMLWSPSVGDMDSDGKNDVVAGTREGYIFAWSTRGTPAGDHEWWTYHHDNWRTGLYGVDTQSPGALRNIQKQPSRDTVSFTAPGGDWYAGTPAAYRLTPAGGGKPITLEATAPAGATQTLTPPAGVKQFKLQAVDAAGNLGAPSTIAIDGQGRTQDRASGGCVFQPGSRGPFDPMLILLAGLAGLGIIRRRVANAT